MIDVKQPLETMDGKPVRYVGQLTDGRILVEVTYRTGFLDSHKALEVRYANGRKASGMVHSGDDLRNKIVETAFFRNVYDDGTVGATAHKTYEAARDYTKYGKTAVAILKFRQRNGQFFAVELITTAPRLRARPRSY